MSERRVIPEVCRRSSYCLREDRHDGRCQPATKREQNAVRRINAKAHS